MDQESELALLLYYVDWLGTWLRSWQKRCADVAMQIFEHLHHGRQERSSLVAIIRDRESNRPFEAAEVHSVLLAKRETIYGVV